MNKYCKVYSNVVKGTTNCTWYVTKRGCKLLKNWLKKQIFKVIINRKMRSTLIFQYSQVIDMKSWTRPKMCNQTEEM